MASFETIKMSATKDEGVEEEEEEEEEEESTKSEAGSSTMNQM